MPKTDPFQSPLDPEDWQAFRQTAHALLDGCIDRLSNARDLPWIPVPDRQSEGYAIDGTAVDLATLATRLRDEVMPYATGNTHPRFFGWVHGTGLTSALLSEMVAVTMNSNLGGRDHGLNRIERAVIDWARGVFGFPATASGILVAGTSQATVIALSAARLKAMGPDLRRTGMAGRQPTVYAGSAAHNALRKAVELLGIGSDHLRLLTEGPDGPDPQALRAMIARDRAAGLVPIAIVATAGSVDLGRFDDLHALADVAREQGLWLHVDGAFGAWTRLAEDPWRALSDGIDRADSLACDFHKWMYVPYDCGLVLIRDEADHRAAFAARPSYLAAQDRGIGGGEPWFCDYGIDLSRGARALKVWTALTHHGQERFGAAITENCRQAAHMADCVLAQNHMALAAPVVSNICVFTADARLSPDAQGRLNARIAEDLQLDGSAILSTVAVNGVTCLRAAITNHRTTLDDVAQTVRAVARARDR